MSTPSPSEVLQCSPPSSKERLQLTCKYCGLNFFGTPRITGITIDNTKESFGSFFSLYLVPKRVFLCFTAYFYVFLVYRVTNRTIFLLSLQRKGRLNCRKLQIWLNPLHYNKRRFSLSTMSKPRKF